MTGDSGNSLCLSIEIPNKPIAPSEKEAMVDASVEPIFLEDV